MPKYKHHWPTLKAEYVEGIVDEESGQRRFISLEDVSQKYGIAAPYLRRVASKEGWLQERYSFVTKVEQARKEKKSDKLAGKSAELDLKFLKISEAGLSHVARHFQLAAEGKAPLSLAELNQAAQTLKTLQQVSRLALGENTEDHGGGDINVTKVEVIFIKATNGQD